MIYTQEWWLVMDAAITMVSMPIIPEADAEGCKLPHPNDFALHVLAGIDSPLICQAIMIFLVPLWQEGDLMHVCSWANSLHRHTKPVYHHQYSSWWRPRGVQLSHFSLTTYSQGWWLGESFCRFRQGNRGVCCKSCENLVPTVPWFGETIKVLAQWFQVFFKLIFE